MRLVATTMVRDEEFWIWYALTSLLPHVDELLVFDNHSSDRTVEIIRGMDHLQDKLVLFEGFGGTSEHENRQRILDIARERGATHILPADGDEVFPDHTLTFCRQLLELHEHNPGLHDPPANHGIPRDPNPTDGVLIKNIAVRPIHPGFAGPHTCIPQDHAEPDTSHGAYNYAIRINSLVNLKSNGLEWGRHGLLETGDVYIQSSPHTLYLPRLWYWHMTHHPRSDKRAANGVDWVRPVRDLGSTPVHPHVYTPEAILRPDGPGNPTLEAWGITPGSAEKTLGALPAQQHQGQPAAAVPAASGGAAADPSVSGPPMAESPVVVPAPAAAPPPLSLGRRPAGSSR